MNTSARPTARPLTSISNISDKTSYGDTSGSDMSEVNLKPNGSTGSSYDGSSGGVDSNREEVNAKHASEFMRNTASLLLQSCEELEEKAHAFEVEALHERREAADKAAAAAEMRKTAERLRVEYLAARRREEGSHDVADNSRSGRNAHTSSSEPERRLVVPKSGTPRGGTSAGILGMLSSPSSRQASALRLPPPTLELRSRKEGASRSKSSTTPTVVITWPHHLNSEDNPADHSHYGDHHHHHHDYDHHNLPVPVPHNHNHHLDVYDQESKSFKAEYSGTQKSHAVVKIPHNSYIRARMRYENEFGEMTEGPETVIFGRPHAVRVYGCGKHCAIFWNLPRGVELDNLDKRCNLQFVLEMAPKPALSSLGLVYEEVYVGVKPYAILATLSLDMTYKFRLRLRYERAAAGVARGQLTTEVCKTEPSSPAEHSTTLPLPDVKHMSHDRLSVDWVKSTRKTSIFGEEEIMNKFPEDFRGTSGGGRRSWARSRAESREVADGISESGRPPTREGSPGGRLGLSHGGGHILCWAKAGDQNKGNSSPVAATASAALSTSSKTISTPTAVEWHIQLRRRDGKFTSVYRGTDQACQISGLNVGTLYEVRLIMVFAWTSAPESSSPDNHKLVFQASSASRFFLTSPRPPSLLGSSVLGTTFAWEPVSKYCTMASQRQRTVSAALDDRKDVTIYSLYVAVQDSFHLVYEGPATTVEIPTKRMPFLPLTYYECRLRVSEINHVGGTCTATSRNTILMTGPDAIEVSNVSFSSATLNWGIPDTSELRPSAARYVAEEGVLFSLELSSPGKRLEEIWRGVVHESFVLTGLQPSTRYRTRVVAQNGENPLYGPFIEFATASDVPSVPRDLNAKLRSLKRKWKRRKKKGSGADYLLKLSWKEPERLNGSPIEEYALEMTKPFLAEMYRGELSACVLTRKDLLRASKRHGGHYSDGLWVRQGCVLRFCVRCKNTGGWSRNSSTITVFFPALGAKSARPATVDSLRSAPKGRGRVRTWFRPQERRLPGGGVGENAGDNFGALRLRSNYDDDDAYDDDDFEDFEAAANRNDDLAFRDERQNSISVSSSSALVDKDGAYRQLPQRPGNPLDSNRRRGGRSGRFLEHESQHQQRPATSGGFLQSTTLSERSDGGSGALGNRPSFAICRNHELDEDDVERLERAWEYIQAAKGMDYSLTFEVQLRLSALYLQATRGRCPPKVAEDASPMEYFRWAAWKDLERMPPRMAKARLLGFVHRADPRWESNLDRLRKRRRLLDNSNELKHAIEERKAEAAKLAQRARTARERSRAGTKTKHKRGNGTGNERRDGKRKGFKKGKMGRKVSQEEEETGKAGDAVGNSRGDQQHRQEAKRHAAAIKLQSSFRGAVARKRVRRMHRNERIEGMVANSAASKIQRQIRKMRSQRKEQNDREREQAVIKIQASCRGRLHRKRVVAKQTEENAAKSIQRVARERRARQQRHRIETENVAASKIQARFRGRMSRKRVYREHRRVSWSRRYHPGGFAVTVATVPTSETVQEGDSEDGRQTTAKRSQSQSQCISVTGAGEEECNGVYIEDGTCDGALRFISQGERSDGRVYVVQRIVEKQRLWIIASVASASGGAPRVYYKNASSDRLATLPPVEEWKLAQHGMLPVPHIEY